jgi:chromodomain-helicase-DNA-binding protein 7
MTLIAKLLPKLKAQGKKVLIFSQFTIVLDLLEDYMHMKEYEFERLDGSTSQTDRQLGIDRFNTEGQGFVYLLSTRAGGMGITLTAADTAVIYDSDWNPQNDLQGTASRVSQIVASLFADWPYVHHTVCRLAVRALFYR